MIKNIRNKFLLALVAATAAGLGSIYAADVASPPPAASPAPTAAGAPVVITGKIVVVDKVAGTITVEVDGKLQQLVVGPNVKMVNNGKLVTLAQLAAGQEVAVLTRQGADGSLQVVALSVEPSSTATPAAGKGGNGKGVGGAKAQGGGKGLANTPFTTLANPANNLGPIISPSQ